MNVRAGDAGTTRVCDCGNNLRIPPLSVLQESATDAPAVSRNDGGYLEVIVFACTIAVAVLASMRSQTLLIPVGLVTILVGRLWFAMQILREMAPANALMVLFVPFVPTIFFFQRLEIAWKPFVYGIMGIAMLILGLSASHT